MANRRQDFWDIMAKRTQQEIADHLATKQSAPTIYLKSQLASMEQKAATKSMSEPGFLSAAEYVMRAVTKQFRPDEMQAARKDEEFVTAATRLRELLLKALDLVGPDDQGPTVTGDSTQVAAKSSDAVERDAQGVRIKQGEPVQRDAFGRVLRD